jgi:hypothetical protein
MRNALILSKFWIGEAENFTRFFASYFNFILLEQLNSIEAPLSECQYSTPPTENILIFAQPC